MQTFLIVLGIFFLTAVAAVALGIAWLRMLAAKAARFVLRTGVDALSAQAKADYAGPVRERFEAASKRINELPEASIWNAGSVITSAKALGIELAEISQELDRLKAEDQRAKAEAITVEATDVTPGAQLALPAPAEGAQTPATTGGEPTKSHDEILAAFREEFVTPGNRGVVDAWLIGSGDDTCIQYQLALEAAEQFEKSGTLSEVPHVYHGLSTIITWFPRQS